MLAPGHDLLDNDGHEDREDGEEEQNHHGLLLVGIGLAISLEEINHSLRSRLLWQSYVMKLNLIIVDSGQMVLKHDFCSSVQNVLLLTLTAVAELLLPAASAEMAESAGPLPPAPVRVVKVAVGE